MTQTFKSLYSRINVHGKLAGSWEIGGKTEKGNEAFYDLKDNFIDDEELTNEGSTDEEEQYLVPTIEENEKFYEWFSFTTETALKLISMEKKKKVE